MIVLDTSAAIELLLALPLSAQVQERLREVDWQIAAPDLLNIEVLQVLRRRVSAGICTPRDAEEARSLLRALNIRFYEHSLLADRVWDLRENLSAYDATYVALAELLNVRVVTSDAKLAGAPGIAADIVLVE